MISSPSSPTHAAVTCGPPSLSSVATCATASLSRSARAALGIRIPATNRCYSIGRFGFCAPQPFPPRSITTASRPCLHTAEPTGSAAIEGVCLLVAAPAHREVRTSTSDRIHERELHVVLGAGPLGLAVARHLAQR